MVQNDRFGQFCTSCTVQRQVLCLCPAKEQMEPYKWAVVLALGANGLCFWWHLVRGFLMAAEVSLCCFNTEKELKAKANSSFENPFFFSFSSQDYKQLNTIYFLKYHKSVLKIWQRLHSEAISVESCTWLQVLPTRIHSEILEYIQHYI